MHPDRTNTLVIRTPEGIAFPLSLAGPVTRLLAWTVDLCCIILLCNVIGRGLPALGIVSEDLARALTIWAYFVVSIGYGIATEWLWRGQTLGKRVLRLRVVDAQGLRLQFSQIAIRNLLRFVDALPAFYLVGGIACVVSRHAQRLGDLAANTVVVRITDAVEPDIEQIMAGKYNSFRNHPHLIARLRQNVTPREAGVALQALLRREQYESAARVELFAEIAAHLRQTVAFPPEASENLSDEQYLRNAVDVLFRK